MRRVHATKHLGDRARFRLGLRIDRPIHESNGGGRPAGASQPPIPDAYVMLGRGITPSWGPCGSIGGEKVESGDDDRLDTTPRTHTRTLRWADGATTSRSRLVGLRAL